MNNKKNIIVIGGGVIGASIAYYLTKNNCNVTLVERDQICSGSSYGNAGLVAYANPKPMAEPGVIKKVMGWMLDKESPFYIKPRLNLDLIRFLLRFQASCRDEPVKHAINVTRAMVGVTKDLSVQFTAEDKAELYWEKKGRLLLYKNKTSLEKGKKTLESLKEFGVSGDLLDLNGVHEKDPSVNPSVVGGIFYPDYEHVLPERYVKGLVAKAEEKGADIHTETEVIAFETSGRQISRVITTRGDFEPDQVIVAAGCWSPMISKYLGFKIPIQPAKGYSVTWKGSDTSSKIPISLVDEKIAVSPMGEYLRFSSNLELVGYDSSINLRRVRAAQRRVEGYLSGIDELELVQIWRGFRPGTPDTLPIIERSDNYNNLILATGHDMLGMVNSLVTGKLVSEIVNGEEPSIDLTPFRLSRFW
ncbi:MAG: FAD-dependent oxidoreductase [bacterium]|nr:FAD-dependent oxidoreductase [bacterium]